jgi:uncharacterized protein with FMN-binding domain
MPKRGAAALTLTGLALALLLNFRTPAAPETVPAGAAAVGDGASGGTAAGSGGGSSGASGSSGTSGSSSSSGSGGSSASGGSTASGTTFDGPVVDTRYGPVQVEITVANGQLADVTALQLPDQDRRSASISSRAEPILRSEALSAKSAAIDGVSGATYTSFGYEQSLQAALDAAGI